jgi:phospholipase/carboxylesterase
VDQYVPKLNNNARQYREIFPRRAGPKPLTTHHEPHQQITQHGPVELWDELVERAAALPDVTVIDSLVSVPGAQAFWLDESVPKGPDAAFQIEREFAHVHTRPDGSVHLMLPLDLAALAMGAGWGEPHTYVFRGLDQPNSIMLYAARTREELDVVWMLVEESYRYARGEPAQFTIAPVRTGE